MTKVCIFNDGIDGSDGHAGHHGVSGTFDGSDGSNGGHGERGEDGTSAGAIDVHISAPSSNIEINYQLQSRPRSGASSNSAALGLGDPSAKVKLSAVGGHGGRGGRGGDGGAGAMGRSGHDATQHSSGTNGGPGGNGGNGGRGGDGGHGGNGADINVHVQERDMDLVMILKQKVGKTRAGAGGAGGSGGSGGHGGSGGRGGSSYSWSETTYYYENGEQRSRTIHHSNPGGMSGHSGSNGRHGSSGNDGHNGHSGNFAIRLTRDAGNVETYPSPYDLSVLFNWVQDTVGYKIIEPACDIQTMVAHRNVGGMPTPSHQLIRAYVNDNQWVNTKIEHRVPLAKWIAPGQELPISHPIFSNITDVHGPSYGDPLNVTAHLEHRALVDRVNQDFKRVAKVATPFTIEFPVQNSLIRGGNAILFGEEAPVVFSIWNKSALGIGRDGDPARVLATTLHILPLTKGSSKDGEPLNAGDIRLRNADGEIFDDIKPGLQSYIPLIHSNTKQFFSTTLQFTNPDLKPYTRVCIESCLHLGHVKNMMVSRNIQIRSFEVQFAESYSPNPAADYLVIVNNQTQYDEMLAWRNVVRRLGGFLCVWNLHLYGDLSLSHVRKDFSTLLKDFRCKNIIYLNNLSLRDEKLQLRPVEFARKRELFLAARDHGINTLVFGSSDKFDLDGELVPANINAKFVYFKKRAIFLRSMGKLMMPGEGDVQAFPATAEGTLCGILKRKKELWWCVLNLETRTLCSYESARQQFPDGMIYLGHFTLYVNDAQTSFEIVTPGKKYTFEAPVEKEYKSKHDKYSTRTNYTLGIERWVEVLRGIETLSPKTLSESTGMPKEGEGSPSVSSPSLTLTENGDVAAGYLKKQGRKMKFLTRYYFRLDANQKSLAYSASKGAKTDKGSIYLGRYTIDDLGNNGEKVHLFRIATPTKILVLAAESHEEKVKWITTLQSSVPPTASASIYREQSTIMKVLASPSPPQSPTASSDSISPPSSPSTLSHSVSNLSISSSLLPPLSPVIRKVPAPGEGEPIEHNTVPRITIEGRYLFTQPKPKQLERKAKRLQQALYEQFPNQTNIVVYDFDATKARRGFRLYRLGTVDVYRSLDATTPAFVTAPVDTDDGVHSAEVVNSPPSMYALMKSLTFVKKLDLLDVEFKERPPKDQADVFTDRSSHIGLLMTAILSDIADEQKHFHKPHWRSGLNSNKLPSRLNTLSILLNYSFTSLATVPAADRHTSPIAAVLTELVVHAENITEVHTTIWDTLLPFRRGTQVAKATGAICKAILWQWIGLGAEKEREDQIKETIEKLRQDKKASWKTVASNFGNYGYSQDGKKFDRHVGHSAYYFPPGLANGGTTNSHARVPKVLSAQQFNAYYAGPRPDGVVEGRFNVSNDMDRYASVDAFQRELGCVAGTEQTTRTKVTLNVHPF